MSVICFSSGMCVRVVRGVNVVRLGEELGRLWVGGGQEGEGAVGRSEVFLVKVSTARRMTCTMNAAQRLKGMCQIIRVKNRNVTKDRTK